MGNFFVYILYSEKLKRFYIGQTQNIEERVISHNKGFNKYSKKGVPWYLVAYLNCNTRSEALRIERKMKNLKSQKRIAHKIMTQAEWVQVPSRENGTSILEKLCK